MDDLNTTNQESRSPSLRDQILQYLRYWPWFILTVIISLGVATIYLRYTTNIYSTKATILIKDEKNSALSEMAAFQDLGLTGSMGPSGFENELQILKSKSLTERVVNELGLNIMYLQEKRVRTSELYENKPFTVTLLTDLDSLQSRIPSFYVKPLSDTSFELWEEESISKNKYNYGEPIELSRGEVVLTPNSSTKVKDFYSELGPVKVVIREVLSVTEGLQR